MVTSISCDRNNIIFIIILIIKLQFLIWFFDIEKKEMLINWIKTIDDMIYLNMKTHHKNQPYNLEHQTHVSSTQNSSVTPEWKQFKFKIYSIIFINYYCNYSTKCGVVIGNTIFYWMTITTSKVVKKNLCVRWPFFF